MNRIKLKLMMAEPIVFTLEHPVDGQECQSRFSDGPEWRFNIVYQRQDAQIYLPVDGKLAIKRSGARDGDEIQLVKQMRNQTLEYQALKTNDGTLAVPSFYSGPAALQNPYDGPTGGNVVPHKNGNGVRMLAPQRQEVVQAVVRPLPAPAAQTEDGVSGSPLAEQIQRCYVEAGRAIYTAWEQLNKEGYKFVDPPTIEDVRCGGTSLFIARTQNPGGC